MSDPVVHITNGVPDSGTGNITTLGQTLTDGANATHGAIADPAVIAGATGTISAKLRSISRDIGTLVTAIGSTAWDLGVGTGGSRTQRVAIDTTQAPTVGSALSTASVPVVMATDDVMIGSKTETAPASDTASSGLNGRLQRIAQRLTTLINSLIPTATANGMSRSRVTAAASTNATSVKASAGQVYHIDVFNNAAYAVFLKLYNKASAPTVGTDTPIVTIPIPAGGGYAKSFPAGSPYSTGVAYAITKLVADSDTTVVAANDLVGEIHYV